MLLANIPVNIITGFLGAGKTSFIKCLLAQKPRHERWAVLVNEFGEIGLDGALLGEADGVAIREVPGGCLCCAAGVPTKVAIAGLLKKAKPHRLLIEPTGLGHPANILQTLQSDEYRGVLELKSSVCLVDPRNLADSRYTEHALFNQQMAMADMVLASKADCYAEAPLRSLSEYLSTINPDATMMAFSREQPLAASLLEMLDSPSGALQRAKSAQKSRFQAAGLAFSRPAVSLFDAQPDESPMDFNPQGFVRKPHQGEGLYACGWCFAADWCFDFDALMSLCEATPSLRLKAVMITADGILAINRLETELNLAELDDALDSRIEFISRERLDWDAIEKQILRAGRRQNAG